MPKLPVISGKKLLKCFLRHQNYCLIAQHGSHVILLNEMLNKKSTIPIHANKDLPKGTLKSIMSDFDLDLEDLLKVIHG